MIDFRNALAVCSGAVINHMDLSPWSTSNPHFIVSGTLLADSVARAKKDVHKILQQEMDLWEQRMFTLWNFVQKGNARFMFWEHGSSLKQQIEKYPPASGVR